MPDNRQSKNKVTKTTTTIEAENAEGDQVIQTDEVVETEVELTSGQTEILREELRTTLVHDVPGTSLPPDLPTLNRVSGAVVTNEGAIFDSGIRRLGRGPALATPDLPLWWIIEESTDALQFRNYKDYIDKVMCNQADPDDKVGSCWKNLNKRRFLPFTDTDAYRLLKVATEAFVSVQCGVKLVEEGWLNRGMAVGLDNAINLRLSERDITGEAADIKGRWLAGYLRKTIGTHEQPLLPYLSIIRNKLKDLTLSQRFDTNCSEDQMDSLCDTVLNGKLTNPCMLELIWSYWHEQGMLVQTLNALSRRFQNIRGPADKDPLAMVEIDPLRGLNNLLWGYIQDEQHRLTVVRRAYEYDHEYGLTLEGKAVPTMRPVDSRSKFLDSFHNLLHLATVFYRQDDDTTVISDAFPILVALSDVHMLLVEGAHNQFGDMPSTARIEMLMQQWILARPEFRETLPTRVMVDYPEPWMERVDAMKRLQGWTDVSSMHFHDLARYGEQVLLSIRFGNWNEADRDQAKVWARWWRSAIQRYMHAYRIVTGVDLTADATQPQQRSLIAMQPAVLLRNRLPGSSGQPMLPAPTQQPAPARFRERRAQRSG